MCGRFVITSPPAAVRLAFGYLDQPNFPARYNVAPTQPIPVVMVDQGARRFALMRWGLIPSWVKDPRQFSLLINARAETVLDKPAFRNAMKRRRCLVPADGYYEWQRAGARKQPYFIHPRDGAPLGLAALAETWVGPNGEELDTVAIITAAATEAMAVLHDRVPVAIDPADVDRWLDCAGVTDEEAATLLRAPADGMLIWHPVSTAVNRVANDNAQLILPMAEEAVAEEISGPAPQPAKKAAARKPPPPPADSGQGSLF
jgi:putative SOS response-associated peptidase YedK